MSENPALLSQVVHLLPWSSITEILVIILCSTQVLQIIGIALNSCGVQSVLHLQALIVHHLQQQA